MGKDAADKKVDANAMLKVLNTCYDKALVGLPGEASVSELASKYLEKYPEPKTAAKKMCDAQVKKCGASGFVTGLGGLITLPVAIPANLASVIYVQLHMIATVAKIGGFEPSNDEVRTIAYICLTGQASVDFMKQAGIKIGEKIAVNAVKKIPRSVLTKINQKVGFRLVTKFGEKGLINIGKMIPVVGGGIGAGIDIIGTKLIAKAAINEFLS